MSSPLSTDGTPPVTGLVSVVVPVYRSGATLPRSLGSIFAQQWPAMEVIVVDDGSGDGTAERVQAEYGDRVRVLALPVNGGAGAARNAGIAAARGEFVAFLDADDEWLPDKLVRQVPLLQADRSAVFATCDAELVELDGRVHRTHASLAPMPGPDAWKTLLAYNFIPTPTVIARRDALVQLGGFDARLVIGEDLDLWIRLALMGSLAVCDTPLVRCYMRAGSLMRSTNRGETRYVLPMLLAHLEREASRLGPEARRSIEGQRLFDFAYREYRAGAAAGVAPLFWQAFRRGHRPLRSVAYAVLAGWRALTSGSAPPETTPPGR